MSNDIPQKTVGCDYSHSFVASDNVVSQRSPKSPPLQINIADLKHDGYYLKSSGKNGRI